METLRRERDDFIFSRKWLLMTLMVVISACASGPRYADSSASLSVLDPVKTRLIIFREDHFVGSGLDARVKIDGTKVGVVPNGSVLIVDHAPGELKISLDSAANMFDGMDFNLTTESGQQYFIQISPGPNYYLQSMSGALPYLMGSLTSKDPPQFCKNGWCYEVRSEAEAMPKLPDLEMEKPVN